MIIETQRLVLRELTMSDLDDLHRILSNPESMKHYPEPFAREKSIRWIDWNLDNYAKYGFGLWAVILKKENRFIGDCGITMQSDRAAYVQALVNEHLAAEETSGAYIDIAIAKRLADKDGAATLTGYDANIAALEKLRAGLVKTTAATTSSGSASKKSFHI